MLELTVVVLLDILLVKFNKLEAVIEYLKNTGGYDYELYNRLCPGSGKPDSNIVEYAEDVLYLVNSLIDNK